MANIIVKRIVPNGKECFGCKLLIPQRHNSGCYLCGAFATLIPIECDYDYTREASRYERHIYKCDECKQAEVKDE